MLERLCSVHGVICEDVVRDIIKEIGFRNS